MVMEVKIISLTNKELHTAVTRHLMRSDEKGRDFFIKDMKINETHPISAAITIERSSGRIEERKLDHSFLAAAILRFCMDNKIPLPRSATKNLQVMNGLLSIFLSMETKDPR